MSEPKVIACENCGILFKSFSDSKLCKDCRVIEERLFKEVRKYIRENQSAGVAQVAEACGVSTKKILSWVREERLAFSDESEVGVPCLQCGVNIPKGKYCDVCRKKMTKELKSAYIIQEESLREDGFAIKKNKRLRFAELEEKERRRKR